MINDEERNLRNKLRAIERDKQYKNEGFNYYCYRTISEHAIIVNRRKRIRRMIPFKKQLKVIAGWGTT